jgi:hypothetical protein
VTIERLAPLCDVNDCVERADYFWLVLPGRRSFGWVPACHRHVQAYSEDLGVLFVAPIAEMGETPKRVYDELEAAV